MNTIRLSSILRITAFVTLFISAGCFKKKANAEKVSTDIEKLSRLINLPVRPDSAIWEYKTAGSETGRMYIPGPGDYSINACLKYDSIGLEKIKLLMDSMYNRETFCANCYDKDMISAWFPESVKTVFVPDTSYTVPSSNHQTYYRINEPIYSLKPFEKSPLIHGQSFMTKDGWIFIHAFTM